MAFHLPRSRGLALESAAVTEAGGRASAFHGAVSRMAAPAIQSLLYQPQEARVASCGAAKMASLNGAREPALLRQWRQRHPRQLAQQLGVQPLEA